VSREEVVYEAVKRWVAHDPVARYRQWPWTETFSGLHGIFVVGNLV